MDTINPRAFGLACTVAWTELVTAMRKDGHTVNDKSGPNTRTWMERIIRDTFTADAGSPPVNTNPIDLEQFREVVTWWRTSHMTGGQPDSWASAAQVEKADRLLSLIDAQQLDRRPKSREVARIGDMSPMDALRVGFDSDNDVYLSTTNPLNGVEFCTIGAGGGKSPRTRDAIIALMVAMEEDNARDESRDWWAQRNKPRAQPGPEHAS